MWYVVAVDTFGNEKPLFWTGTTWTENVDAAHGYDTESEAYSAETGIAPDDCDALMVEQH